jgi:hypothetical protein
MRAITITLFLVAFFFAATGKYNFYLWGQVEYLHKAGFEVTIDRLYSHAHSLRFLLVQPIYGVADYFSIQDDRVFSCFVVFCTASVSALMGMYINGRYGSYDKWMVGSVIFLYLTVLTLFMNGRLIYGFLAYSLAMYACIYIHLKESKEAVFLVLITLVLFLSSVSSGIALSLFIIMTPLVAYFMYIKKIKLISSYVYLSVFLAFYIPIIALYLGKNITFYSDIIGVLTHGVLGEWGGVIPAVTGAGAVTGAMSIVLLGLFFIVLVVYVYEHRRLLFSVHCLWLPVYFTVVIMCLSIFARSILMMGLIPVFIMIYFNYISWTERCLMRQERI